ncbi:MAG: DUF2442 domain-containing protein [Nitrospirae bacterium]|nr:MAG: DUF2442 domain-containing protein [Nitrospirota bacterium]
MNTLVIESDVSRAEGVTVTDDTLSVDLNDGRTISVPLAWFPRLMYATAKERKKWKLIGSGHGIHWEDIDEDISVEGLLSGKPSGESRVSFKKWLDKRQVRHSQTREDLFNQAVLTAYKEAVRKCNHKFPVFKKMFSEHGGIETAKRLLHAPLQAGFTVLWECKCLDLSIEYLVLKSQFANLFTEKEKAIAKKRLEDHDYKWD